MKHYENLEKAMCRELEKLDKKYDGDVPEMSVQDVERADVLYHALKSAETYYAMKDAEWEDKDASGRSYRRGRDSMGRYVSRDMDGYSGHYPPMYDRYPSYDYGGWR
jgi:hypothetical protein